MGTAIIVVAIFVFVGGWAIQSLGRSAQKAQGKAKCQFCGKRLKKVGAGYASACKNCGRMQPWAEKKAA